MLKNRISPRLASVPASPSFASAYHSHSAVIVLLVLLASLLFTTSTFAQVQRGLYSFLRNDASARAAAPCWLICGCSR